MRTRAISLEARERLRKQQADEAKAVSEHTFACSKLEVAVARRAEVTASQDRAVAATEADVAVAAVAVVAVSGFSRAAAILGVSPAKLRRQVSQAKAKDRPGRSEQAPAPTSGRR